MWTSALFHETRLSVAKLQGRPLNKQMLSIVRISPRTNGKDSNNILKSQVFQIIFEKQKEWENKKGVLFLSCQTEFQG
jgi:hypothetical protein